jgi:hypothetical protein
MRTYSILYVAALAALCFDGPAAARPYRCTQQSVTGTFALAYEGTVFMTPPGASQTVPLPTAGLAVVSIDPEGAFSSAGYQTIGGSMAYFPTMPGTIKVNDDCTGTVVWGGGGTATVVISNGGDEMHSMMTQSPMAPMVVYGTWNRISRASHTVEAALYSPGSVYGTYAARQHGYLKATQPGGQQASFVPGATVGIGTITQDGAVESTGTVSTGGQIVPFESTGGAIQVKTDCTGTMTFTAKSQGRPLGQVQGWFLVLDGGDTLWTMELSTPIGNPITLGTMTRISRRTSDD